MGVTMDDDRDKLLRELVEMMREAKEEIKGAVVKYIIFWALATFGIGIILLKIAKVI
jgi:hypothetical protein